MADNTILNPGLGGHSIVDEEVPGGAHLPVAKVRVGAHGTEGSDVTEDYPMPSAGLKTDGVQALAVGTLLLTEPLFVACEYEIPNGVSEISVWVTYTGAAIDGQALLRFLWSCLPGIGYSCSDVILGAATASGVEAVQQSFVHRVAAAAPGVGLTNNIVLRLFVPGGATRLTIHTSDTSTTPGTVGIGVSGRFGT